MKIEKHKCLQCDYEWYGRDPERIPIPKQCPNCKRMDWRKK